MKTGSSSPTPPEEAATFHEDEEGYNPGDATAEFVMEIPPGVEAQSGWPSHDLMEACGATIEEKDHTRVVRIGDRTFCEGLTESEKLMGDGDASSF